MPINMTGNMAGSQRKSIIQVKYFDKDAAGEVLRDLLDKAQRGELFTASLRVYRADGTYEDIVLGAESEEERLALLADIKTKMKSGTH